MHIVILRFSTARERASEWMAGHKEWIQRGFGEGVFLLAGSIEPDRGGVILAHNTRVEELGRRVGEDPFVREKVVEAEILTIDPGRADERLSFLVG